MNSTALPKSLKQWLGRPSKSPSMLPRKSPLRPFSKKREAENRIYLKKRKAFLAAHPYCQIWLRRIGKTEKDVTDSGCVVLWPGRTLLAVPRSTEIHHTKKRGRYYLDELTWLAASREEHRWVHRNPAQARAIGLLL